MIPLYRNPALAPGLDALSGWLEDHHYSQHARERIVAYVAVKGTPTGSAYLEPEDEGDATDAFTDALLPLPDDSLEWDDPSVYLTIESLDDRDRRADRRRLAADPELCAIVRDEPSLATIYADALPPVAGGASDDDPMSFPSARPHAPLPDRYSVEALANIRRIVGG